MVTAGEKIYYFGYMHGSITYAVLLLFTVATFAQRPTFVSVKGHTLQLDERPYYFVGTNYWYGSLLGLEKDKRRGIQRLRIELDFLKRNGVTNLRLMAGVEGSGMLNGVMRVGPSLQPEQGKFDERVLDGLDLVLAEMAKRDMKAVVFFSNNWEWSGGFQQYLIWNGFAPSELLTEKPEWDDLRYWVARFYICGRCMDAYMKQVELVLNRQNRINKRKYTDDPTIMAWELANEPRPMRPAYDTYMRWIRETAAAIKARDKNHLVTIGHEGSIGTQSMRVFEDIHRDPNIDYLTIHIWAKNWEWYTGNNFAEAFPKAIDYVEQHVDVAKRLNKPLVIEEFGMPRDPSTRPGEKEGRLSFEPSTPTTKRDEYYRKIFSFLGGHVAGANFWAFGGTARPVKGQVFWKPGDEYMGDPPMEEQGLNTVYDSDRSTWNVIRAASGKAAPQNPR